jgi:hypothetical protein
MKTSQIVPEFVTSFPGELEPGRLYVSVKFSTAAHLCACGCRREVVTPLSPAQWVLTFDGTVSLKPSIGNWALPCQSHYVVDHGTVRWARGFTRDEIQRNRDADHQLMDTAYAAPDSWWLRLRRRMKRR